MLAELFCKPQIAKLTLCAIAAATLAACGGGSSNSPSTASNSPTNPVAQTPTSLSGTVATGAPVSGANVTILDSTGKTATATADANGNYQIPLSGLTPPFAVFATDPSGIAPPLTSVVAALPANSSGPATANVTSLTTAVAALVTQSGNPLDLTNPQNLSTLATPAAVSQAVQTLNNATANILTANNLNTSTFNPITTPFTANQSGADAVLDSVQVVPATGSSGGLQLISSANPNSSANLTLNSGATASAALPAPPATGAFLAPLMTALTQCLGGSSASCSQAMDASYKDNGFTSFSQAHPALAASDVSLGVEKVLEFVPGTSGKQVLIALPYTTSTGLSGIEYTVAQQTSTGWDIVGNQQQYNISISSFLTNRRYLDSADANLSRYEAGLNINIPIGATGTPNPTNLASASVSGPGINGTIWLLPTTSPGISTLELMTTAQTTAPTGGATTGSGSNNYRWSWQSLPGASGTYAPGTAKAGWYTPSPIDVSTVPQYAAYTVTFYDASGNQIGKDSVVNPTPIVSATNGPAVPWQTLSEDSVSNFLNPQGPLAGAQPSVGLTWSNLINGANIAPLVTNALIQAVPPSSGSQVDGSWTGPVSYSTSGQYDGTVVAGSPQQCSSGCTFPPLNVTGTQRLVDLSWSQGGTAYNNEWMYLN